MSPTDKSPPGPRKFVAATSREALRLVRESLGSEAMVLASRALPDGVEIVAMAEDETRALLDAAQSTPAVHPAAAPAAATDSVLTELHSMRTMIEERLGSVVWNEQQRRDPVRGRLLRTMLGAGFSARLSKAMLEKLPAGHSYADGVAFVKSELLRTTPVHESEDALLAEGGVYALVGPTGVGKTTTTAKLAARCVMRFGADKLALVTTDGYRIGAYEQLRIYGQILNVPVYAVKDKANLQLVLQELRDKHMVLIDTVGMSQRDRSVSDQIAMLCNAGRPVKRLLLLNAASHGDTLNEVVYAYQQAGHGNGLAGCIFTKLDEAASYGALLDTVIRHRLPVHYLSNGQRVPENLTTVDPVQLIEDVFQAPLPGALFVCDPDLDQQMPEGSADEVASAKAQTDRLRLQYEQLIRAMTHDAQEVAAAAQGLAEAGVGFESARRLWALAGDGSVAPDDLSEELLTVARTELSLGCDKHVLAVCGRVRLEPDDHGDCLDLQGSILLSDRDGQPFAAPNQWLAPRADARTAARQIEWLRLQEFDKPMVHVLARLPAANDLARWQAQHWIARAAGSMLVLDPQTRESVPLVELELRLGGEEAIVHKGKPALQVTGEATALLRCADGTELAVRCIARRILAGASKRLLEQCFMMSNLGPGIAAAQVAQWQEWAAHADSCFRMTGKGLALMGGAGEPAEPAMFKRLLVAGQVATTAWRLQHMGGERAERTRVLLTELAGRQVRLDRPQSGNVLYEGLAKLFHLLEALGTDSTREGPQRGSGA